MLGFRAVSRLRATRRAEAVVVSPVDSLHDAVVETPSVPCNNLRAHWVMASDGKLELRWELDGAHARTHAA